MYSDIAIALGIFLFGFAFSGLVLKRMGWRYVTHPLHFGIYFSALCFVQFLLHKEILSTVLEISLLVASVTLFILMISISGTFWFCRRKLRSPVRAWSTYSDIDAEFLHMRMSYIFVKSIEIAFQQLFIAILIVLLHMHFALSVFWITFWLLLLFGVVHIGLLLFMHARFVVLYASAAVIASLFFPSLILQMPNGVVYTYVIHWMFYVVVSVSLWVYYTSIVTKKKNV